MPQSTRDLPPHLRPVDRPRRPEVRPAEELPLPIEPPAPPLPEIEAPRRGDPFLRQS